MVDEEAKDTMSQGADTDEECNHSSSDVQDVQQEKVKKKKNKKGDKGPYPLRSKVQLNDQPPPVT
ncbi:hypothetical protein FRX31_018761 [Thalictrum thalictroides]|uniref:Uncharacterized protein n=1 Tax=Thalictrum thalictroides TaxID=46969 RepID=A0A7J6W546_THATH|nr:hypothetical protein FRX31_018761 [Thalictrum thalictroides]